MRRLTALLAFVTLALLLAACAAPAPASTPAPSPSPTPWPTATPQPPTATPTATLSPSPTPLPAGLGDLLGQLHAAWATNATYTPATPVELARLAQDLGVEPAKLGQVYRVEAENGAVFWASAETGQTYAERQVPAYWKYENGEKVDVPAHEEAVIVEEAINNPREFAHWGDGKVVKVKYEDGHEGWLYRNEQGEWAKIYESGFDYEFLSQVAKHFEEVKGKTIKEWVGLNMGGGTFGAITDLDRIRSHPEVSWWEAAFKGVLAGAEWVKLSDGENGFVVVEAFLKYDRNRGENDVILVPVWVGMEEAGKWQSLIGGTADGRIWFVGDDGRMDSGKEKIVERVFSDENFGKTMLMDLEVYGEPEKIVKEFENDVGAKSDNPHAYFVLSPAVIKLVKERKLSDWGMWFASLPKEEQEALLASSEKGKGILPWIVFEDTEKLEALLEKYPLPEKPVGFVASNVALYSHHKDAFGVWIFP